MGYSPPPFFFFYFIPSGFVTLRIKYWKGMESMDQHQCLWSATISKWQNGYIKSYRTWVILKLYGCDYCISSHKICSSHITYIRHMDLYLGELDCSAHVHVNLSNRSHSDSATAFTWGKPLGYSYLILNWLSRSQWKTLTLSWTAWWAILTL